MKALLRQAELLVQHHLKHGNSSVPLDSLLQDCVIKANAGVTTAGVRDQVSVVLHYVQHRSLD